MRQNASVTATRRPIIDRFQILLAAILLTYALSLLVGDSPLGLTFLVAIQLATVWLAFRAAQAVRLERIAGVSVLILLIALATVTLLGQASGRLVAISSASFAISTALYVVAPFIIVRYLALRRVNDVATLYGAICGYLMIGMSGAFVYRVLGMWQEGPFFGASGEGSLPDDLFFSFTTLTTVGYGNLVPAGNPGQTIAVGEALIGQLFLVIVVAKVVSNLPARRQVDSSADDADSERPGP